MARHPNANWNLPEDGPKVSWECVHAAILMDLRDELQKLNRLLHCADFKAIPGKLDRIGRNTEKKKKPA